MRAAVIALVIALAGGALADDKGGRKVAERHFRAGEKAFKAQNFGAAAANFEEAYRALPLPEIAYSAAQAYRRQYRIEPRLERARRALELYRLYLDKVKTGGQVGRAADYIGEMQREVDKLVAAGARVARDSGLERTRLGVSPMLDSEKRGGAMREIGDLPDADLGAIKTMIDGKEVPPFEMMDVVPGPHVVRVEAEGYQPYEATERVVKGASTVAEVLLVPKPARVTLTTEGGARVRVDGRGIGTTPLAAFDLPAGKHLITIVKPGRVAVSRDVEVTRGQALALAAPLEKTGRRRAVPIVATGAIVFGALAVAGLTYAVIEDRRADDQLAAIQTGDQRPGAADAYDRHLRRRDEALTVTFLTGGAALAIGGIAAALYWLDSPSDEAPRVTPAVTAGGAVVTVLGRF